MRRLGILLGLLLALALAGSAAAQDTTIVWQVNLEIPVINRSVLGTVTTIGDSATGEGTWSFQGTVDGKLATASGKGRITGSGSTATVTLTEIDTWNLPGVPQPRALPISATIRTVGNLAYVSYNGATIKFTGLPLALSAPITFPLHSGTYTVTMAGTGAEGVTELPRTGVGEVAAAQSATSHLPELLLAGGALAAAAAGLALRAVATRRSALVH